MPYALCRSLYTYFPCPAFYKTIFYTACGYIRVLRVFFGNVDEPFVGKTALNGFFDECLQKTDPMFALDLRVDCEDIEAIQLRILR